MLPSVQEQDLREEEEQEQEDMARNINYEALSEIKKKYRKKSFKKANSEKEDKADSADLDR
jgi:hypothetical protein